MDDTKKQHLRMLLFIIGALLEIERNNGRVRSREPTDPLPQIHTFRDMVECFSQGLFDGDIYEQVVNASLNELFCLDSVKPAGRVGGSEHG